MNNLLRVEFENTTKEKLPYESPRIDLFEIELEHSIAAGSALVMPEENVNDQVFEEWYVDPDEDRTINW